MQQLTWPCLERNSPDFVFDTKTVIICRDDKALINDLLFFSRKNHQRRRKIDQILKDANVKAPPQYGSESDSDSSGSDDETDSENEDSHQVSAWWTGRNLLLLDDVLGVLPCHEFLPIMVLHGCGWRAGIQSAGKIYCVLHCKVWGENIFGGLIN